MSDGTPERAQAKDPAYEEISDPARLPAAPLVSVLMITFNHAGYLAEAIEGVVSQRCEFPFELIVGEDASTDGTLSVALDYQARFPHIVRVVRSIQNAGFQTNIRRIFGLSRGRYIAWCEGDDYWCATDKLRRQVALFEADPQIGAVHTDWVRAKRQRDRWQVDWQHSTHRRVPRERLQGTLFRTFHYPKILRTCTRMARRSIVAECFASELGGERYRFFDTVLAAYICSRWRIGYVADVTAVYRESQGSILRSGINSRIAFLRSSLEFDTDARMFFHERGDYPAAYRWELGIGLMLWGIRARNWDTIKLALHDLRRHFGPLEFLRAGMDTLLMRRPRMPGAACWRPAPAAPD